MKSLSLIALLTILSTTQISHAQTDLADNAALRYYQAIVSLLGPYNQEYGDAVRAIRLDKDWIEPTPEVRAALEAHALTLKFMSQGAAIEPCDFGIDFSEAYDTLFVGIQDLNACARLLLADACRALEDGDTHTADQRVAQSIQVARHFWRFAGSIGPLVSASLVEHITQITTEALDRGLIQPEQLAKTAKALAFLDQRDPFDARSVIELERTNTHALVNAALNDPDGDTATKLDKVVHQAMGVIAAARDSDKTPNIKLFNWLLSEDPEEARAELRGMLSRYDRFTDETLATLDTETPCESAEELRDRIKDYGLLSQVFADSLPRLVYYSHHTAEQLRELADRLGVQPSAASTHRPEQINAALLYWPAFGYLLKEDRDTRDLTGDAKQVAEMSDELREVLLDHQETFELLMRAASMNHCEFGVKVGTFDTKFWQTGFGRRSSRLLVCDAIRCFHDGQYEAAEDRLLAAIEVVIDCTRNNTTIQALTHASAMAYFSIALSEAINAGIVTPDKLPRLKERLRDYQTPDPYNMVSSIGVDLLMAQRSIDQMLEDCESGEDFARNFDRLAFGKEEEEEEEEEPGDKPSLGARLMFDRPDWREQIEADRANMVRFYRQAQDAFLRDDAIELLSAETERMEDYGNFAAIFAPFFEKMVDMNNRVRAEVDKAMSRLESPQITD
ncbi:MAG: hypothetical protein KDA16_08295 [Phycisphaerales bacterium]|nr:hypothetical protein [Phycisphaerales bacterium]